MLNRRLIRIKVFKVLYASVASNSDSLRDAEKMLDLSCSRSLYLYYLLANSAVALKKVAAAKMEAGLKKFNPTEQERNPNRRFVENRFSAYLEENASFTKFCEEHGLMWGEDLMPQARKMYALLSERDYFRQYMQQEDTSPAQDAALFREIFSDPDLFEDNEALHSCLEDMSLFWMDDVEYVLNVLLRDMDIFRDRGFIPTHKVFLKDDDREFAFELLRQALTHYKEYETRVTSSTANWDPDRVITSDMVLIIQGIAEAVRFSSIPLKVTINEYVDISKFYGSQNSRIFVNGLLDTILRRMTDEGEVVKKGRGLIEE